MTKLISVAKKSPHPKNKHSTLVFRGGSLLNTGYNHDGIHSEVNALDDLWPSKRKGVTVVNLMIQTRSGNFGVSRPCQSCMIYLIKNGIKKIIWFDGLEFREERL
jgi:hypothetical protein